MDSNTIDLNNVTPKQKDGDEIVYELTADEYNALVTGLTTYKQKFEEASKALQDEKENVVDLLLKIDTLQDRVKALEESK